MVQQECNGERSVNLVASISLTSIAATPGSMVVPNSADDMTRSTRSATDVVECDSDPYSQVNIISINSTGWHIRLVKTSCWHWFESCVLVWGHFLFDILRPNPVQNGRKQPKTLFRTPAWQNTPIKVQGRPRIRSTVNRTARLLVQFLVGPKPRSF